MVVSMVISISVIIIEILIKSLRGLFKMAEDELKYVLFCLFQGCIHLGLIPSPSTLHSKIDRNSLIEYSLIIILSNRAITHTSLIIFRVPLP